MLTNDRALGPAERKRATGRVVNLAAPIELTFALRIALAASFSGFFVYFAAEYARLRGELVRAEQQLSLTQHGRLAATQLGRIVTSN